MSANAGRADLNVLLKAPHLEPGEPFMYLRARDPAAFDGALAWAAKAKSLGVPVAVIEQGLRQADAMLAWPTKQLPDASHLKPAQALQLAYAHGRRAWNHRNDEQTLEVLLAEQRGWDAAMAEIRAEKVASC